MATVVAGIALPEGDPAAVESAAGTFDKVAGDFASTAGTVSSASTLPSWQGVASITFRTHCGSYGEAGRAGSNACRQAALALRRYGHELADARDRVRELQRQGEECVQRIQAAELRAAAAAAREAAAHVRGFFAGLGSGADGGAAADSAARDADAARAEREQAQADADAARAQLHRLQQEAAREREQIAQAAKAAAGKVRGANALLPAIRYPQLAPSARLKVPDPGESPLDRLFGRDYVYPEEAASVVLEASAGGAVVKTILRRVLGAAKPGAPRTRLAPGGGLAAHEGVRRGHTLLRHVGLSDDALRLRLQQTNVSAASSFTSRALAEDAVSGALLAQRGQVSIWLASGRARLALTQEFDQIVGRTLVRGAEEIQSVRKVLIVLVRDNSKLGYHIKTAYPTP